VEAKSKAIDIERRARASMKPMTQISHGPLKHRPALEGMGLTRPPKGDCSMLIDAPVRRIGDPFVRGPWDRAQQQISHVGVRTRKSGAALAVKIVNDESDSVQWEF
jgi:hypothetical protein